MAERIIYNLDPTAICRAAWKTCSSPTPAASNLALAQQALAVVQKLDPPGVGARDLRECLLLQLTPGMPLLRGAADADRQPPGRPGAQPPAGHRAEDGLLDRADPGSAGRAAQAESQAGRRLRRGVRAATSRPTCSSSRTTTASTRCGWKTAARRACSSAPTTASCCTSGEANDRDPRVHQAEDQLGPVADRVDRAAPQHADPRGAGDRRSSDRVSRQGARVTSSR